MLLGDNVKSRTDTSSTKPTFSISILPGRSLLFLYFLQQHMFFVVALGLVSPLRPSSLVFFSSANKEGIKLSIPHVKEIAFTTK